MKTVHDEVEERTRLTGNNKCELLLFHLGDGRTGGQRELYAINVFKVREVLVMPPVTELANAHEHLMGVANIRGQIIPVINLPAVMGCEPKKGLNILMVTEFARTVQAFAVEGVHQIACVDWDQVLPAGDSHAGPLTTGIARLDGATANTRLAQVLDVEQILQTVMPQATEEITKEVVGPALHLPAGSVVLVADDSAVARSAIENGLKTMGIAYVLTKTGKEAWERLKQIEIEAKAEGKETHDKVALVLTDLEMPEMDGFTLTRQIKEDRRFKSIPVIIHSSLTGTTNENHVKSVGADGYVAKFAPRELAETIRTVLTRTSPSVARPAIH